VRQLGTLQFVNPSWDNQSINVQAGNPGFSSIRTIGDAAYQAYTNNPFRSFAAGTSAPFNSYQMFLDLDAAYQLFGPNNGYGATIGAAPAWFPIGLAGSDVNFALQGASTLGGLQNNVATGVAIVPEPSSLAIVATALLSLGAGRLVTRSVRRPAPT